MSGLKFLVIFMGILIVVGTSFLVFTIIKRGNDMAISQKEIPINTPIEIISPKNMTLNDVNYNNKNIILTFEDDNNFIIQVININSGEILKKINIKK